jgi:hypothetical protein
MFPEIASDGGLRTCLSNSAAKMSSSFRVYIAAKKPIVYMDSHNDDDFVPCATV